MFMLDQDCPWPFQNIMAQYDRWTLKVLSLPVFQEAFSQAVLASPLADPAFVIALDADSATDQDSRVQGGTRSFCGGKAPNRSRST